MEINPKKLRFVMISEEMLQHLKDDIEKMEKDLECKLFVKTPSNYYGISTFIFYSENFEEIEKNSEYFLIEYDGVEKVYKWLKLR